MKLFLQIFSLILVIFFSIIQANSVYKFVEINDEGVYFLEYSNINTLYKEKIINGIIEFSLMNNNRSIEFICGELGCFFINNSTRIIKDNGDLIIQDYTTGKIVSLPYEGKLTPSHNKKDISNNIDHGFDISNDVKIKSIQKRILSCEISATADILSHLSNKKITEDILLKYLPKSKYNTLPYKNNGKKYWGNPQEGFVGYIDTLPNGKKARQRKMTGYGVLEKPIEKIINQYGYKTKIITQYSYLPSFTKKKHLTLILKEIEKGNMIQLWGDICTNPKFYNGEENPCTYKGKPSWDYKRKLFWYYIDSNGIEEKYSGLNGEHAFYLLGYKGDINNPSHVIVWDTYTGKHTYVTSEWMRKWKKMQYRSIITYAKK